MVIWRVKQIGKVKKLDKWVPHELTKIPKNCSFEGPSSLILWDNNELFLNQIVTYDKKCFLYDKQWWPVQWLDQEEGQSTFQSQTPTQKRSRLLFSGLLSIWSTRAFWILAKPLHLRSMFSKSMRHTEKCNAWAGNDQQKGPNSSPQHCLTTCRTTNTSKVNELRYKVLSPSPSSPVLLPTKLLFQASRKLFAGKMLPQPAGGRKCFPRVHRILTYRFLHYRNKQIYFSLAKMCWL